MSSSVPKAVSDFIFDLHESSRVSQRQSDVSTYYDIKLKELSDKYYTNTTWPEFKEIAGDCNGDETFQLFYNEFITRHQFMSSKLKPSINDYIKSWNNYIQLLEYIISASTVNNNSNDIALTLSWINDIIVEFVYQFQGFCQFRSQVQKRNNEDIRQLTENNNVWTLPKVVDILNKLIQCSNNSSISSSGSSSIHVQFGIISGVELVRLNCLIGDYSSALVVAGGILNKDSNTSTTATSDLFTALPVCMVNFYYHTGISYMMIRQYSNALDTFSDIITYMYRILKHGGSHQKTSTSSVLTKVMDKVLTLTAITSALYPGRRLDDQVRESVESKGTTGRRGGAGGEEISNIEAKWIEKLRRLSDGDITTFTDLFEQSCPKFISPAVPDYTVSHDNNMDAFSNQITVFMNEIHQYISVLKIRSYMRLYTSIDISKLARFNEVPEAAFISQLLSYKHKTQVPSSSSAATTDELSSFSDVQYRINGTNLMIDTPNTSLDKALDIERIFTTTIRKNNELKVNLLKYFSQPKYNL